jgi:hypothetical protein
MSKVTLEPTGIVEYYDFKIGDTEGVFVVTKDLSTSIYSLEYQFDPDNIPDELKEDIKKAYQAINLLMHEKEVLK